MQKAKLTPALEATLESVRGNERVEIVVELEGDAGGAMRGSSRHQRIAALKERFEHNAAPVQIEIIEAGGEVLGAAWINQTLRASIPVTGVDRLSELTCVARLDVPHALEPESA